MKNKITVLFLLSLLTNASFAQNIPEQPTSTKYTLIKTTHDYTPVREDASVNAKRFSHLKKGTTVFADKDIENFYRIDLGLNRYYWLEKKYAEETTPEKTEKVIPKINEIDFGEIENYYTVSIGLPFIVPYNEIETSAKTLDFILYDVQFDETDLKITTKTNANFKISKDEFNNLKISYESDFPLSGHEIVTDENKIIFKVKKPFKGGKKPLKNITITIDPGHGGADSGAVGNNLKEKDLNLQISKKLKKEFKSKGAKVYLTRETDENIELYERVNFAKEKNSDFLLSIHQNSLADISKVVEKHGVGVYYYNKEAYEPAKEIQEALVKSTGLRDDGVNFASFALTRAQNPICILIECAYIICEEEAKKLSDENFQKLLSKSIVKGLNNYLKNNY